MKLLATTIAILLGIGLSAQDKSAEQKINEEGQKAKAVLDTETGLDKRVTELNERMKKHTILFRQKVSALPGKLILHKGKADGDKCVAAKDQTAADNDCLKLETFDFQDSEWGKSDLGFGSRAKYMIVFYEGGSTGTDDPRFEAPRNIKKIIFNSKNVDFAHNETHFANIDDGAPHQVNDGITNDKGGAHDDKTIIYYANGFPTLDLDSFKGDEQVNQKGVGKYKLKNVENSKTHSIRNDLKKIFFIKNVDKFDKMFIAIADTNERYALKKYKDSNNFLKNSLKY